MPFVRTGDVETYYEMRGDGHEMRADGPPVVFVHAAVLDHAQWDDQVDALADDYTTVTYDVRGHGRTGGSGRDPYSIDLFAEDLRALIAAVDLERPVVVGHSTGGCVAQTFASRWPDELAALVLADTFGPRVLTPGEWLQRSVLMGAVVPPVRIVGYERVERAMIWLQERVQGEGVSGEYERIQRLREAGPRMTTAEFAKVIGAIRTFAGTDVDLGAVDVPALVLYGENEAGFVKRHAARFAGALPDATVAVVPDAGHASNLDDPEAYTGSLETFLAAVHGTDPPGEAGER